MVINYREHFGSSEPPAITIPVENSVIVSNKDLLLIRVTKYQTETILNTDTSFFTQITFNSFLASRKLAINGKEIEIIAGKNISQERAKEVMDILIKNKFTKFSLVTIDVGVDH